MTVTDYEMLFRLTFDFIFSAIAVTTVAVIVCFPKDKDND